MSVVTPVPADSSDVAAVMTAPSVIPFPKQLGRAVGFVLSGDSLGRVLGFAGNVLAARVIGVAGFGMLGMVRSTLSLAGSFTDLGISNTASRFVAHWSVSRTSTNEVGQLLGLVCILGASGSVFSALALLWLAPWLAHDVYTTPALAPLLVAALPWMMATVVGTFADRVLLGYERFETVARLRVARGTLSLVLLAAALLLWRTAVLGAVVALGLAESIVALLLLGTAWNEAVRNRGVRIRWPAWHGVRQPLRSFALPSYVFLLLQAPVSWFLLTRLARVEQGSELVGAVQATGSFQGMLSLLPAALATTLLPMLSRLHSGVPADGFSSEVRKLTRILWFFAAPIGALVAAMLPSLMLAVFGKQFGVYAVPCTVLVLVTAWSIVNEVFDQTLAAMGEMWLSVALGLGYAAAAIGLTVSLIPTLELWGYVIAQFVAMAAYVATQQWIVGARVALRPRDQQCPILLALVGGTAAVGVAMLDSVWLSILGALGIGALLMALSWQLILGTEERQSVVLQSRLVLRPLWKRTALRATRQ